MKMEQFQKGARVRGLAVDGVAAVKSVEFHGSNAAEIIFTDARGGLRTRIVSREDEPSLDLVESVRAWSFDADGDLFRLVSEARRIELAWLFDPHVAITSSTIEPLPLQISAVYEEMLPRQPMRFLLADDPGAGKTIMAGLLIKELMIRGDLERCLIVSPGSLTEQWQDELAEKFGLEFDILTRDMISAARTANPFESTPLNLDKFQENQVGTKVEEFDNTLDVRLYATYAWGIAPRQADPTAEIEWEEFKVGGEGTFAERATARFTTERVLRSKLGGVELRGLRDKHLWVERDHVSVAQLAEWFARYLYLPRVTNRSVLELPGQDGAPVITADDTFAVAATLDEAKKRYNGLKVGEGHLAVVDRCTLLVRTQVAWAQRERERGLTASPGTHDSGRVPSGTDGSPVSQRMPAPGAPKLPPNTFVASVKLDPTRVVKDAGRAVVEVLEHLSTLPDAEVEVTLEMRVRVPDGIKETAVRTVSENAKTLKFQTAAFERE